MIEFRYGMIVGADIWPSLRVMMIAPWVHGIPVGRSAIGWQAIVLADKEKMGWRVGEVVTLAPDDKQLIVYEESV